MTGGDKEAFDKVKPVLACMGSPVYTGGPASGSVTKLVNNMIGGAILVAIAEGYAFAAKAGIDLQTTFEATRGGFAGGPMYDNKVPKIIKRDYTPRRADRRPPEGHPERQALCPQAGHRHAADRCGPPCDGLDERQRPHRRGPGGTGQVLRGQDGREGRPGGDGRLTLVRRSISECAGTGCLSGPRAFLKRGRRLCRRPLFDSGDQVCSKGSRPGKALLQRIQRLSGIRSVCGDRDPRPRSDGQGEHTQQAFWH